MSLRGFSLLIISAFEEKPKWERYNKALHVREKFFDAAIAALSFYGRPYLCLWVATLRYKGFTGAKAFGSLTVAT